MKIEDFYGQIIHKAPFGYAYHEILLDDDGIPFDYRFIEVNEAFEKLTGLKKENLIGKTVREAIPGIEKSEFDWIGFYGKIAIEGGEKEFEQYSEPLKKWYLVSVYSTEKLYFTTLFINLTVHKQQEQALRESEEFDRRLLATIPDLVIRTDVQGNIIYVNETALANYSNVSKDDLMGQNILSFIHEKDKERAIENSRLMLAKPLGIKEYTLKLNIDNVVDCEVNGDIIRDSGNNPIGMVYMIRDITQHKTAEITLTKINADLLEIVTQLNEAQRIAKIGSWIYNFETKVLKWSDEVYNIYGLDPKKGVPDYRRYRKMVHPDYLNLMDEAINQALKEKVGYSVEIQIKHSDGSFRYVHQQCEVERNIDNNATFLVGTSQDITERKNAENELKSRISEMERFHKLTVGRELNMIDLKREVNALLHELGKEDKYKIVE
jgi:PAS domain S-box-containing protein